MAKIIVILKAILTRIIFATHGFLAIWRVTSIKGDPYYWYLTASILALAFEGVFTLTIKSNQEWKWFCPSVFFYLCSVVPAIWLIEVDKFDRRLASLTSNQTVVLLKKEGLSKLGIGNVEVDLMIPVELDAEAWATVIEQLLMLILIIGRWMLPKGKLTRDQLSQLLLVYIGTAADIIEFFDSFKDEKIASQRVLCLLILSIWSWSLLQFTFVLTATKARRTRLTTDVEMETTKATIVNGIIKVKQICCSIDVWAILINIILQDAPFLIFRLLLILYYKIISYMNIFFTSKNTLVIILQFYRLFVVQQEKNKEIKKALEKYNKSKGTGDVPSKVAKAIEQIAMMGPSADARTRIDRQEHRRAVMAAQAFKKPRKEKRQRSQDSFSSQNSKEKNRIEQARLSGRRKSMSTGDLRAVTSLRDEELFDDQILADDRILTDDQDLGVSGSILSGTNNERDSLEESDLPIDNVSLASERPSSKSRRNRRAIRLSENPGIYQISGSRSSDRSSDRGHGHYRQDTGYSSSSRDSATSVRRSHGGHYYGNDYRPSSGRPHPRMVSRHSSQNIRNKPKSHIAGGLELIEVNDTPVDYENERI